MRPEERGEQKERLVLSMIFQEADGLARNEAIEVVLLRDLRYPADGNGGRAIIYFAQALPRIAEVSPQVVNFRQARAGVWVAQFIGVELGLRSHVLEPVVETEVIVETVGLGVHEMHLADQGAHIAGAAEMVGDGLVFEGPRRTIRVGAVVVRVEAGQQGSARRRADRIGAVGAVEANAGASQSIQVRRLRHRLAFG